MDLTLGQNGQPGVRGCRLIQVQGQAHVQQGGEGRKQQLPQVLGQARGHDMSGARGRESWERLGLGLHGPADWVCTLAVQQEEKQAAFVGVNMSWRHVSSELRDYVRSQEAQLEWGLGLLHVLLSCTFLLVLRA